MAHQSSCASESAVDAEQTLSQTNLYIRGLNQNTTDEDLYNLCQGYEIIIECVTVSGYLNDIISYVMVWRRTM